MEELESRWDQRSKRDGMSVKAVSGSVSPKNTPFCKA
jgi:hypothetical protein